MATLRKMINLNVILKVVFLFSVFVSLAFSDNVILTNGTKITNCFIIHETDGYIIIRSYYETGTEETTIPLSQIKRTEKIPRNKDLYTITEVSPAEESTKPSKEIYEFKPKSVGFLNDVHLTNFNQFITGITLTVIGYDFIIRHIDIKDAWDDWNIDPSSRDVRKYNVVLFTGILSIGTGILNIYNSFERVEVSVNNNNLSISYLF